MKRDITCNQQVQPTETKNTQHLFLFKKFKKVVRHGGISSIALGVIFGCLMWLPNPLQAQETTVSNTSSISSRLTELRLFTQIRNQYNNGHLDVVLKDTITYLSSYPNPRYGDEALLLQSNALSAQREHQKALDALKKLAKRYPNSPFLHQALVAELPLLSALGQDKEALKRIETLKKIAPHAVQLPKALIWKARYYYKLGNHQEVLGNLNLIQSDQEMDVTTRAERERLLILTQIALKQPLDDSIHRYLTIEDTPRNKAEILSAVAIHAKQQGQIGKALEYYDLLAQRYPLAEYQAEALYQKAHLKYLAEIKLTDQKIKPERLQDTINAFEAYLAIDDQRHRPDALVEISRLRALNSEYIMALSHVDQALLLKPSLQRDVELTMYRVHLHTELGQNKKAQQLLTRSRELSSLSWRQQVVINLEQAGLHYRNNRCSQVEQLLKPLPMFGNTVQRSRALFLRGMCRYLKREWVGTANDLSELVGDPRYHSLIKKALITAYKRSGQYSRLALSIENQIEKTPPKKSDLIELGQAYYLARRPLKTLHAYQRLEDLNPRSVQRHFIQFQRGLAEESLGRHQQALQYYLAVLKLPLIKTERIKKAKGKTTKKSVRVLHPLALNALKRVQTYYIELGNYQAALDLQQKILVGSKDAKTRAEVQILERRLRLAWGDALHKKDNAEEAVVQWKKAYQLTPKNDYKQRMESLSALLVGLGESGQIQQAFTYYEKERKRYPAATQRKIAAELGPVLSIHLKTSNNSKERKIAIAFHKKVLTGLPPANFKLRAQTGLKLSQLYQEEKEFTASKKLLEGLAKLAKKPVEKTEIRHRLIRMHQQWGVHQVKTRQFTNAKAHFKIALSATRKSEWKLRYAILRERAKLPIAASEYTGLIVAFEDLIKTAKDSRIRRDLRQYTGRLYNQWAAISKKQGNTKSLRVRYLGALKYLPKTDWKNRLQAIRGLEKMAANKKPSEQILRLYQEAIPFIQDKTLKRKYALYLGKVYWQSFKQLDNATYWLKQARNNPQQDDIYREAFYVEGWIHIALKKPKNAIKIFNTMAKNSPTKGKWPVLIYYHLAVLHHQMKQWDSALKYYRLTSKVPIEDQSAQAHLVQEAQKQTILISQAKKLGSLGNIAVPQIQ